MAARTMRASRLHGAGEAFRFEEIPVPKVGPGDALVRIVACGTQYGDHQLQTGDIPLVLTPIVPGHEPTGIVHEVGADVTAVAPGDRVYVDVGLCCGTCEECRGGRELYCAAYAIQGMTAFGPAARELFDIYHDGGFAEYMLTPATNLIHLPGEVDFEVAAKAAFPGVGLRALERARFRFGETVLVNGAAGVLGLSSVLVAKAMGATRIFAVDKEPERLVRVKQLAPDRIETIATNTDSLTDKVQAGTRGRGVDVLIDTIPNAITVTKEAISNLRAGGRAVLIGGNPADLELNYLMTMIREIEVMGGRGIGRQNMIRLFELIARGVLDLSSLVTHRFRLDQVNEAIETIVKRKEDPLGVIIVP